MKYRKDNVSGNELSVLGFGCMRFPKSLGTIDMIKTEKLILKAIEYGVNYFDTAFIYGGSEEALGTVLKKNDVRDKVFIASKLPIVLCKGEADFDKYFNKTLERLQTDHIDYYLIHMLTDMASWKRLCDWGIEKWIADKKESGQIRQIGFSFHGIRDEFISLLDAYDWEFCQIQYNYSDINYQAGVTGLKKAAEKNIPVFIMEPLLGGKLANGLPKKAVEIFEEANPALSPAAWALKWLYDQPEVTVVLSGMNSASQLKDNLKISRKSKINCLTDADRDVYKRVVEVFNSTNKVNCTGCNYCMPCPKNVNIPSCFSAYNTSYMIGRVEGMKQYTTSIGVTSEQRTGASQCVKCGLCEKHCPQKIEIRNVLEDVKNRLEPMWFRAALKIVRTVLGKDKNQK